MHKLVGIFFLSISFYIIFERPIQAAENPSGETLFGRSPEHALERARDKLKRQESFAERLGQEAQQSKESMAAVQAVAAQLNQTFGESATAEAATTSIVAEAQAALTVLQQAAREELADNQACDDCVTCCQTQCISSAFECCWGDSLCKAFTQCGRYCARERQRRKAAARKCKENCVLCFPCCTKVVAVRETTSAEEMKR
jgi:hypothetical protein